MFCRIDQLQQVLLDFYFITDNSKFDDLLDIELLSIAINISKNNIISVQNVEFQKLWTIHWILLLINQWLAYFDIGIILYFGFVQ